MSNRVDLQLSMSPQYRSVLRTAIALSLLALVSAGCATSVQRVGPQQLDSGYKLSAEHKVSQVTVTISDEARDKLKDNLKFDPQELRQHVERALSAYAIVEAKQPELPVVDIVVTSVRVRSNFSAVMWGFMAGADSISGDILIKDQSGKQLDRFHVSASYALGGFAGGQDSARMGWLYEAFAKNAADELRGVRKK